jgi:excisionase family DNA binding protein
MPLHGRDVFVNVSQAARLLRTSPSTVRRMCRSGELAAVPTRGDRYLHVSRRSIDAIAARQNEELVRTLLQDCARRIDHAQQLVEVFDSEAAAKLLSPVEALFADATLLGAPPVKLAKLRDSLEQVRRNIGQKSGE